MQIPEINTGVRRPIEYQTFVAPPEKARLKKLFVYVDEFGDRNFKANRQSDFFGMTALIVPEENDRDVRYLHGGLCAIAKVGAGRTLHWVEHFRKNRPESRAFAHDRLAGLTCARLVHVALHKPSITGTAAMRAKQEVAYNYVTKFLVERVARAAADWPGGERVAVMRFGIVGGVDHGESMKYLHHVAAKGRHEAPWGNLIWPFRWHASGSFTGLQVADAYTSLVMDALVHGSADGLLKSRQLFCGGDAGSPVGPGFYLWPREGYAALRTQQWWREFDVR